MSKWPTVPLKELVFPVSRELDVKPGTAYRTIGVRWWGEGAYERKTIDGSETRAKKLTLVKQDDLIINKIWVRHGSTAVAGEDVDGCAASNEFPTFSLDPEQILTRWMHWICKTQMFWSQCDALSMGTSGKNRIKPERFLTIEIPLPPLPEQQKIVEWIDAVATRVEEAKRLRTESNQQAAALIFAETTRVFEQLNEIPTCSIGQLGVGKEGPVQTGPFGAQLHSSEYVESGVPVLNVGNVWPSGIRLDRLNHVTEEKAETLNRYSIKPEDILFARSGATLGKVCIVPEQCDGWIMSGHLFRVRLDHTKCLPKYLLAALRGANSVRGQVFDHVRGATRPGFNTKLLSGIQIPLPPVRLQQKVVSQIEAIHDRIGMLRANQSQSSEAVSATLPSILNEIFNGEGHG